MRTPTALLATVGLGLAQPALAEPMSNDGRFCYQVPTDELKAAECVDRKRLVEVDGVETVCFQLSGDVLRELCIKDDAASDLSPTPSPSRGHDAVDSVTVADVPCEMRRRGEECTPVEQACDDLNVGNWRTLLNQREACAMGDSTYIDCIAQGPGAVCAHTSVYYQCMGPVKAAEQRALSLCDKPGVVRAYRAEISR